MADLITGEIIDIGELKISKTTLGKKGADRYLIYLPMNRNYLWRMLYQRGRKVRLFLMIPSNHVLSVSGGSCEEHLNELGR
jgi:hypothetical protein